MDSLSNLLAIGGFAIILAVLLGIGAYVVSCLAIYRILKLVCYKNSWFAWIPILNVYGMIDAFKVVIGGFPIINVPVPITTFKIIWGVSVLAQMIGVGSSNSAIAFILSLLNIVIMGSIFTYIYAVFENQALDSVKLIGILSGLIGIIAIVKFYSYNESNLVNNSFAQNVINANRMANAPYQNNGNMQQAPMTGGFQQNPMQNQGMQMQYQTFQQPMQMQYQAPQQPMQMQYQAQQQPMQMQSQDPSQGMQIQQPMQMQNPEFIQQPVQMSIQDSTQQTDFQDSLDAPTVDLPELDDNSSQFNI